MIAPSPAPKPPRRTVWPWVLIAVVVLLGALVGLAWWLVPPWLERVAVESLTTRLERRLEQPVTVGRVDFDLPTVTLHDLAIGEPGAMLVRLDEIEVELDEDALWSGRAEPVEARVRGGLVQGERAVLEDLARRLRRPRPEPEPEERGRIRLVPRHLSITGLALDVWQGERASPLRGAKGVLELHATPAEGKASIALGQLELRHESIPTIRAAGLRTDLVLVRTEEGRALRFPLSVQVEGMGTQVTSEIAVAGVEGRVTLADPEISEVSLDLEGGFSDRDDGRAAARLWSVAGRVRRDLSEGELSISMDAFRLGKVPEVLARLPVIESEEATVGGRVALVFGSGLARAEGQVRLDGLNVHHRLLARDTVRDVGFGLDFAVEIDPRKPRITLHHVDVERGGVQLRVRGELVHPTERNDRRYRLHAEIPPTPCQEVLEAIPTALVPSLEGFGLAGRFDLSVDVDVDFADLDALRLDGGVGIDGCRVQARPPRAAAERLAGAFTHRTSMRDGRARAVHLYPGSGTFTPLDQISPYMVQAVLTTEDGGFWRHKGFLPSQFRTALRRNLEAGEVRLGASTITMQMVKNVLLSHERTLARKLQEMILTWYVETALTKQRIMEIYLNIVELGPGIYGVTRAAQHYFGKDPGQLTPPEAAYLALMLPSPVRRHAQYCQGELSPRFQVKLTRILRIMHERGRLDALDYEVWKEGPLEFDLRERGDTGDCLGEIAALMEASEGQRALTGLLAGPEESIFTGVEDQEPPAFVPIERQVDRGVARDVDEDQDDELDVPIDDDPANADAPGRPAMDEVLGDDPE
ncbi:MAG: transglycosylase domain-containing protein [Myxococcales bacterium]|nr:transglycosylase domain-containing protein [Myxococcales bacterium]